MDIPYSKTYMAIGVAAGFSMWGCTLFLPYLKRRWPLLVIYELSYIRREDALTTYPFKLSPQCTQVHPVVTSMYSTWRRNFNSRLAGGTWSLILKTPWSVVWRRRLKKAFTLRVWQARVTRHRATDGWCWDACRSLSVRTLWQSVKRMSER